MHYCLQLVLAAEEEPVPVAQARFDARQKFVVFVVVVVELWTSAPTSAHHPFVARIPCLCRSRIDPIDRKDPLEQHTCLLYEVDDPKPLAAVACGFAAAVVVVVVEVVDPSIGQRDPHHRRTSVQKAVVHDPAEHGRTNHPV